MVYRWLLVPGLVALLGCSGLMAKVAASQELATVCTGATLQAAAPYVSGPGPHPMVAVKQERAGGPYVSMGGLTMDTPKGELVPDTELVLCVDAPVEREVEICAFDEHLEIGFVAVPGTRVEGPSYPRVALTRQVRLIAARTGEVVAEEVLPGTMEPPACDHLIIGKMSAADFRGTDVGDYAIGQWAEPYGIGSR